MNKQELRAEYLEKRKSLPNKTELDSEICSKFFSSFSISANLWVHLYIPIEKFNEIDTHLLYKEFYTRHCRIVVPKIDGEDMISLEVDDSTVWETNKWGIKEPENGIPVDAQKIDMIITPLLCFDMNGYRVGYGKGYYDRLFSVCRKDCLKVGLSYFPPIDKISDIHEQDLPLDYCVTPSEVYEF